MSVRRRLALVLGLVLVVSVAAALYWLPEIVRRVAITRIEAVTARPASIDRVDLNILTGRFAVHGFRLGERDGTAPFTDFGELRGRVSLLSLLRGHLWLRELFLSDSTVRVVRLATNEFNFSDLIRGSGEATGRTADVTVDRFVLSRGTVTLEDRALPEPRTWASEKIEIEAHNVSTRRDDGTATGTSVTAGSPVSIEVRNLRLYPIHVQATVTVQELDLSMARVYLPPGAPVTIDRGRMTTTVTLALDARAGLRADATGRLEDVALVRPDGGDPLAMIPTLTLELANFAVGEETLRLERLALEGAMSVRDPRATKGDRFQLSSVRARVSDLTWPATTPGQVDLQTSIPGGGTMSLVGAVRPPPDATQLRLRVASMDLAPWAQFVPVAATVTGVAEADLRMNEPLAAGIPARLQGSIAVNRAAVSDGRRQLLGAQRIEASGLELHLPERVVVKRLVVNGPHGTVERAADGSFPLLALARPVPANPVAAAAPASSRQASAAPAVEIGEVVVTNGAMTWVDRAVSPAARLELSSVDARVTGLGWPLHGVAGVRVALRPPGGGRLQASGKVGLDPLTADLRLTARNAELAPYRPYVPTNALFSGAADADLAVVVPSFEEGRATARGTATLSRVDVRDHERTVLSVERATATSVDVEWPERVAIGRLGLVQPWILLERDDKGGLPLRALLMPPPRGGTATAVNGAPGDNGAAAGDREPLAVTVGHLSIDRGGMRIVDRAVSPAFAVDFQPLTARMDGFSTVPGKPARLELSGRPGAGAEFALRGTVGSLGGPLRLDLTGELRDFAVPRTNPYILQQAGWKTTEGRLTSKLSARINGDALSARTEIRLSELQLVRAAAEDGAQARIGLPLGMLTSLMKDRRGDITMAFPVGGSLSDPRFDFSEAIWSAVRTVAINAVTMPIRAIGRVHFTADSRIERIEVDPVAFDPGTPAFTREGQGHAVRLTTFLEQLPAVKLALTPVVSGRDVWALRSMPVEATLDRIVREGRLSRQAAAALLFAQRFPGRPVPDRTEATVAALVEVEPEPTSAIPELGTRRLDALRAFVKQAGIDPARLPGMKMVQVSEGDGRIELDVLDPQESQQRPSKAREVLRRLGVPLKDPVAEK